MGSSGSIATEMHLSRRKAMQVMPGSAGALASGRARQSSAPANWQRLQQLTRKYDPDDVFFSYLSPS